MQDLEIKLGYQFKDTELLEQALTHRSYDRQNNERLEFVGDGILDAVIALNLYQLYPETPEGDLSKMRAALVNQDSLVEIATPLDLGSYLQLGDGEIKSGGRMRPSIIADCLEALFAAIYFDGGFVAAQLVIEKLFYAVLREQEQSKTRDYKTQLQEKAQARHLNLPNYEIIATSGPEHDTLFTVECSISALDLKASGVGKGKKQASQDAAYKILQLLPEEI